MSLIQYIPVSQLKIHPQNIRQYYPEADVQEMAASIAAVGGVLQALLVVPTGEQGQPGTEAQTAPTYYVVDGNMRLTAARTIPNCPPLKCESIASNHAEQLLVMAATSHFHYPKDAISRARHFRRLLTDEGLTIEEVANLVGLHFSRIHQLLTLLELEPAVQDLIAAGQLSADTRVARLLLRIPDPAHRVELAQRYARMGTGLKRTIKSLSHVVKQYERLGQSNAAPPPPKRQVTKVTASANGAITAQKIAEIASLHLCEGCRLNGLGENCYTCPAPYEFINHLVDLLPADTAKTQGEAAVTA